MISEHIAYRSYMYVSRGESRTTMTDARPLTVPFSSYSLTIHIEVIDYNVINKTYWIYFEPFISSMMVRLAIGCGFFLLLVVFTRASGECNRYVTYITRYHYYAFDL